MGEGGDRGGEGRERGRERGREGVGGLSEREGRVEGGERWGERG